MRMVVTGANGFIGRRVVKALGTIGAEVEAFDLQPSLAVDVPEATYISGDLVSGTGLDQIAWDEADVVLHLAAAGVKTGGRKWCQCTDVNVLGTQRLLYLLSELPNPPVFLMTQSFYERHYLEEPFASNPYVITKHAASEMVRMWQDQTPGRKLVFCTIFQGFGPGDDSDSVLSYAARQLRNGDTATFGSGDGLRDWVYVDDIATAIVAAAHAGVSGGDGVSEFEIGRGELVSLRYMVKRMAEFAGMPKERLEFSPSQDRGDGDLRDKAEAFVPGWLPQVSIDDGLNMMLKRGIDE